jgi:DNA polymerase-1
VFEFAFDTETYLIQPGNLTPKPVCFSYFDGERSGVLAPAEGAALLKEKLQAGARIVGQNVAFDFGVMLAYFPELMGPVFEAYENGLVSDTKIREQLINLAFGRLKFEPKADGSGLQPSRYSLDALVYKYFGADISASKSGDDVWRLRYYELDGLPVNEWPKAARVYAEDDAIWTWKVFQKQKATSTTDVMEVVDCAGLVNDEQKQTRAALWLHLSSCWGIRTCPDRVKKARDEIQKVVSEYETELIASGLMKANGSKAMDRIKARVVNAYENDPPLTPTGAPKTDRETLEESGDPLLIKLAEFSAVQKLDSTYLPVLESGTEKPINPGYSVLLETGRTSSFSPNIQNLPRKGGVRECFKARPGRVFVKCDYDQFELRVFAEVCLQRFGYSKMADAFFEDKDPHVIFAAQVLEIDYLTAIAAYKDPQNTLHSRVKEYRQNYAKAANFGFIGGMGPRAIQKVMKGYGTETSLEFCEQLYSDWSVAWPETQDFFRWHKDQLGFAESYTHVTPFSRRQRGDAFYTAACNNDIQGPAACAAKQAGWEITRKAYLERDSALFGSRIVAFVHDEFILETPESKASAAALELSKTMNDAAARIIRKTPIKSEPCIMRYWDKNARPVRDSEGNLIVWEAS